MNERTGWIVGDELHKAGIKGIAPGTPEGSDNSAATPQVIIDGKKAVGLLGLKYRTKDRTVVDAIKSIYERFPAPKE